MDASRYLNRFVVFAGEHGKQCVGKVVDTNAYGNPGMLGIQVKGAYGTYCRKPDEVRLASANEVNRWNITGSL